MTSLFGYVFALFLYSLPFFISIWVFISVYRKTKDDNLKRNLLDKVGKTLNVILFLLGLLTSAGVMLSSAMFSTATIGATNPLYITIVDFSVYFGFFLFAYIVYFVALSIFLRRKNKHVCSFVVQFLPILIFVILFYLTSVIPRKL